MEAVRLAGASDGRTGRCLDAALGRTIRFCEGRGAGRGPGRPFAIRFGLQGRASSPRSPLRVTRYGPHQGYNIRGAPPPAPIIPVPPSPLPPSSPRPPRRPSPSPRVLPLFAAHGGQPFSCFRPLDARPATPAVDAFSASLVLSSRAARPYFCQFEQGCQRTREPRSPRAYSDPQDYPRWSPRTRSS